jgi:hypothetical protein
MEALRRLRRGSANTSVDRRLVTNVLLTFLCTPREDTKRFEMLGLLASILSWSDDERMRAGLQRIGINTASSANSPARPRPLELDKTDETEVRRTALPERTPVLRNPLVVFPSLGGVPSCRSGIRGPGISTGDTYSHRSWARSTYTRNGPHDTPTTEGQGARVRSNMKLWTTVFCFTSCVSSFSDYLLVLWQLWVCRH